MDIEGFDQQNSSVRNKLTAALEDLGIKILPDGTYPMVHVYQLGAESSFSVGYRQYPVHGTLVGLSVRQLLPLPSGGYTVALTYLDQRVIAGMYVNSDKTRTALIDDFLEGFTKGKPDPALAARTATGDLDERNGVVPMGGSTMYQLDPFPVWSQEKKSRWFEVVRPVFGDSAYRYLSCTYMTSEQYRKVWYKRAPPEAAAMLQEFPESPISALGVKALDACPADHEAADNAMKEVGGSPHTFR